MQLDRIRKGDMSSKIILITGATRGQGKAALLALAKQGHRIVFVARKEEDGKKVKAQISERSANQNIDYVLGDLMDLQSTHQLVADFKAKYDHLDVLLQIAGANFGRTREQTKDGIENTIALNLIAPYLLNILLIDYLAKAEASRIIITSSVAYTLMANPDFKDIELKENYTSNRAYGNAKLYVMMMAQELDRRVKERDLNVSVNTLHPGFVMNDKMKIFAKDKGLFGKIILLPFMKLVAKTPEKGPETAIYLATSPEVEGKSGLYFSNSKPVKINEKNMSDETRRAIWNYCEELTGTSLN